MTNSDGLNVGVANTVPNASKSAAIGSHNSVDEFSFSLGQFNSAYNYGTVFGYENQAHNGSLVGGSRSLTSPDSTISFLYGENNLAFGSFGVTIFGGYNSINQASPEIATGGWEDYSFIAGTDNEIQQGAGRWGIGNIVLGQYNSISTVSEGDATMQSSVLIGIGNRTSWSKAWAIGEGNIAQTETVTLGTYAEPVANASLIVGRGTSDSQRANGLVVFNDGTVSIPSGELLLGSNNVLTSTALPNAIGSYLGENHYLRKITDPAAVLGFGAFAAWGEGARAEGDSSLAIGFGAAALENDGIAIGAGALSSGETGVALGKEAYSSGESGVAMGYGTKNLSYASTALGVFNLGLLGNSMGWVDDDVLLEVGNGTGEIDRSNALTTLKNGQTTLTNRFWNPSIPTEVPSPGSPAEASGGEALVVEGHTRLRGNTVLEGKVILAQPQGDISMGVYAQ